MQNQRTHVLFGQRLLNHSELVGKYFVNLLVFVDAASEMPFFNVLQETVHMSTVTVVTLHREASLNNECTA